MTKLTKPTDWAWRCQECGKVFRTQRAAERAAFGDRGCPRCGSTDIDMSQAREVEEAARARAAEEAARAERAPSSSSARS